MQAYERGWVTKAGYDVSSLPDDIIRNLFADIIKYGPHGSEVRQLFEAILEEVIRIQGKQPSADFMRTDAHLIETLHELGQGEELQTRINERLAYLSEDASTLWDNLTELADKIHSRFDPLGPTEHRFSVRVWTGLLLAFGEAAHYQDFMDEAEVWLQDSARPHYEKLIQQCKVVVAV